MKRGTLLAPLRLILQYSFPLIAILFPRLTKKTGRFPGIYDSNVSPMTSGIKLNLFSCFLNKIGTAEVFAQLSLQNLRLIAESGRGVCWIALSVRLSLEHYLRAECRVWVGVQHSILSQKTSDSSARVLCGILEF